MKKIKYLSFHGTCGYRQSVVFDVQLVWNGHGRIEEDIVLAVGQVLQNEEMQCVIKRIFIKIKKIFYDL